MNELFVGTAGWSIPNTLKTNFSEEGSHLERYSQKFNCVEINSSFYKEHRPETYQKWAETVGDDFRFSVKLSKEFIHVARLKEGGLKLQESVEAIQQLRNKMGVLLVQLPKSLEFNYKIAHKFISSLRKYYPGSIVWEPRHESWISPKALDMFIDYKISKVLADPEPCMLSKDKRGPVELTRYFRLHGTPKIYKSRYSKKRIAKLFELIKNPSSYTVDTWCIFDNTTYGYATQNAFELIELNSEKKGAPERRAQYINV